MPSAPWRPASPATAQIKINNSADTLVSLRIRGHETAVEGYPQLGKNSYQARAACLVDMNSRRLIATVMEVPITCIAACGTSSLASNTAILSDTHRQTAQRSRRYTTPLPGMLDPWRTALVSRLRTRRLARLRGARPASDPCGWTPSRLTATGRPRMSKSIEGNATGIVPIAVALLSRSTVPCR